MADGYKAFLDATEWDRVFAALDGPIKESLARRMAVEGGVELRDEAKRWAPVKDGTLRNSIYLVFDQSRSTPNSYSYSISWNAKKAPHGHLQEFGHWMKWQVIFNAKLGRFQTLATGKNANAKGVPRKGGPKWIAAKPFLRPAYDIVTPKLLPIVVARGRKELPILLAEHAK
jgi:Bacteriophage protein of unknown function (DUF646).